MTDKFPHCDKAGTGFDIFGKDSTESLLTNPIFDTRPENWEEKRVGKEVYLIPKYCTVDKNFRSDIFSKAGAGKEDFLNNFSAHANVKAHVASFNGEFDVSYQSVTENHFEYIFSSQRYSILNYDVRIRDRSDAFFTENFKIALAGLPTTLEKNNKQEFFDFFLNWGIYYLANFGIGATLYIDIYHEIKHMKSSSDFSMFLKAQWEAFEKGVEVDADIKTRKEYNTWHQTMNVAIRQQGGKPSGITEYDWKEPETGSAATKIQDWITSTEDPYINPIRGIHLNPIDEFCPKEKKKAVGAARELFLQELRPKGIIESTFHRGALINLYMAEGFNVAMKEPGLLVVGLDATTLNTLGLKKCIWKGVPDAEGWYRAQREAITFIKGLDTTNAILLFATSAWVNKKYPEPELIDLLRQFGGGKELKKWADTMANQNAIYCLAGLRNHDAGAEAFTAKATKAVIEWRFMRDRLSEEARPSQTLNQIS